MLRLLLNRRYLCCIPLKAVILCMFYPYDYGVVNIYIKVLVITSKRLGCLKYVMNHFIVQITTLTFVETILRYRYST